MQNLKLYRIYGPSVNKVGGRFWPAILFFIFILILLLIKLKEDYRGTKSDASVSYTGLFTNFNQSSTS